MGFGGVGGAYQCVFHVVLSQHSIKAQASLWSQVELQRCIQLEVKTSKLQ